VAGASRDQHLELIEICITVSGGIRGKTGIGRQPTAASFARSEIHVRENVETKWSLRGLEER
jgi:hypothetical protein